MVTGKKMHFCNEIPKNTKKCLWKNWDWKIIEQKTAQQVLFVQSDLHKKHVVTGGQQCRIEFKE